MFLQWLNVHVRYIQFIVPDIPKFDQISALTILKLF